jgi:hypothetical protein
MAETEPKTLLGEIVKASQGRIRIMDMRKPPQPAKTTGAGKSTATITGLPPMGR